MLAIDLIGLSGFRFITGTLCTVVRADEPFRTLCGIEELVDRHNEYFVVNVKSIVVEPIVQDSLA